MYDADEEIFPWEQPQQLCTSSSIPFFERSYLLAVSSPNKSGDRFVYKFRLRVACAPIRFCVLRRACSPSFLCCLIRGPWSAGSF